MDRFGTLTAIACPLGLSNVDTDQLIPARFMKTPRSHGYGGFLLHELRYDTDGTERSGFILNARKFVGSQILVCRHNFGIGSSREAAVYALWDYGIRVIIAPSFGDIFASNAVKNGLLPAAVHVDDCERLLSSLENATSPILTVDLERQSVSGPDQTFPFKIDPVRRLQLLNGWDDIDLTLRHGAGIAAFRARHAALAPWVWPAS
jgi:3-isopropylmalate/(R)-2-methylmalate dehydratase small subunit